MKKLLLFTVLLFTYVATFAQPSPELSWQGGNNPEETDSATLLFDATGTPLESYGGTIYAHTGVTLDNTIQWQNVKGDWGNNSNQPALALVSGNTYSLNLTPTIRDFYNNPAGTITGINIVLRSANAGTQTTNLNISVGALQLTLTAPTNPITILSSGGNLSITATNTGGNANYILKANGSTIDEPATSASSYSYTDMNIMVNKNYVLEATIGSTTKSVAFSVLIDPGANNATMPEDYPEGINYDNTDPTVATLVLNAPEKDFVYVAGSFNSWNPETTDAMKYDTTRNKFWLTLTGLTSQQIETYQYWVVDKTPIANSPALVKTADPYSTLVLSPFDDPTIPPSTYPSLPTYPVGQEREVTVLQTGKTPYNWQVTNFNKPKKEDLVIYEVLIRDFDADRNFQDIIDKIDYFKNLNINAIELMPVMEFEGNESWGYNTSFHMALDKFYGTEDKFKELVDVCHQNGIAVILDVALNHAFGRNPMVRMWMNDPDNDGWGEPSSENPYFNTTPKHSYNVGSDFDHSNSFTRVYTKRVVKHWIEEFNIDGFRWDLTKGFTQLCSSGDEGCTNSYKQDRVDVLKEYADYSWSLDETHYVIFEHLGNDDEESEWANYRLGDAIPKGIMLWGKMTDPYSQLTMGYANNSNISRMGHKAHSGFTDKRVVGYAESHDELRIMEKNKRFGNSSGGYDTKDLNTGLSRMSALGAMSLTIPGPKMIWHFGELGMDNSIFTCSNGSLNLPDDSPPSGDNGSPAGDCKLDTKPQPQWTNNWLNDANRSPIYETWSRINNLKVNEPVFEGDYNITSGNLTPRISIFTGSETTSGTELKNVVIIANFELANTNVNPNFPYGGTWYDLMDTSATPATIAGSTTSINLAPGEFKMYGNQASSLSVNDFETSNAIKLYPNPTQYMFSINTDVKTVSIYDIRGKLVKLFKGNFKSGHAFDVSNLPKSIYLIRAKNDFGITGFTKLVKF
ncbi:alpha-amylase family glycosyl hydrolase [Algibacter sp. 2305UL17-15]|uniref:alpha-amylase family glycosyl hydrolase n=1 Tax=Algibacter sp. 2305UL17-15 TaxID=3231268 RepID=UPI00345918B4